MINMLAKRLVAHIDSFLMGCLFFTLLVGLFVLYSASGQSFERVGAQALNMLVALTVMWIAANIPPQHLERIALPLYALGILLLLGVALFGEISHGARRWLHLGVVRIQPSELMKIAVPMLLAWYFARREESPKLSDHAIGAVLLAIPVLFIMKQPDLGTSLLIGASGFFILFLAGLSWRLLAGGAILAGVLAPIFWNLLHDYQRRRIEILFDPYQDPLGAGYHTIQASIALGSGGVAGKGWLNGTQAQLDFLPEHTTDFVFSVFAEEFGWIGVLVLLGLYLFVTLRALWLATQARDTFGRLLAGALALTFSVYVVVNAGMVVGFLPVVGVPMPLLSYGGTSAVSLLAGFGIIMAAGAHRRRWGG